MKIVFDEKGNCRAIYTDSIKPLLAQLGAIQIRRASHVEPGQDGNWYVDLSPVGGPTVGPFAERSTAIKHETDWLHNNGY